MNKRTLLSKNTVILVRDFARRVASHLRVLWERQGREREGGGERGREKEREEETERPRKPRLKRTVYCELFPWCEAPPMHPADRMRLPALLPSTGNCSHGSKKTSFAPQKNSQQARGRPRKTIHIFHVCLRRPWAAIISLNRFLGPVDEYVTTN